ncbi:hypothetical protein E4P41_16995 [Geodermatophilus sp. DF01-2]|uniref:hypothetical protein n=1 Tax=Geodermatophilus sp. DF01-2 TaxID=2559610 RepID=UPI001074082F|nr:hypothetical protein [Geodermatophilus sp. DF01_2]TFV55526.1 hypothetical protein E4P41_16995 [Geodermatophilus sp. DF01_2]
MKRTVAFAALWTASAASAVGLGFLAVSLVDAEVSPGTQPIAATESVTAPPPAPDDVTPPAPSPQLPVAGPASGEYATVGGTIHASCDGGRLQVASAPAVGWWLDDQDQHGEVEFESATQEVEVHVVCVGGTPSFFDERVRTDENEPEDSSWSSSPASSSSGSDDSDDRVDDSGGDDDGQGRGRGRGGDD